MSCWKSEQDTTYQRIDEKSLQLKILLKGDGSIFKNPLTREFFLHKTYTKPLLEILRKKQTFLWKSDQVVWR